MHLLEKILYKPFVLIQGPLIPYFRYLSLLPLPPFRSRAMFAATGSTEVVAYLPSPSIPSPDILTDDPVQNRNVSMYFFFHQNTSINFKLKYYKVDFKIKSNILDYSSRCFHNRALASCLVSFLILTLVLK